MTDVIIYIYIYTYVCVCVYIHAHIHIYIHTYIHTYLHTWYSEYFSNSGLEVFKNLKNISKRDQEILIQILNINLKAVGKNEKKNTTAGKSKRVSRDYEGV